jgi:hypothetical protein
VGRDWNRSSVDWKAFAREQLANMSDADRCQWVYGPRECIRPKRHRGKHLDKDGGRWSSRRVQRKRRPAEERYEHAVSKVLEYQRRIGLDLTLMRKWNRRAQKLAAELVKERIR